MAWRILTAALLVQLTVTAIQNSFGVLAPFLQEDLGLTTVQIGLISTYIYAGQLLMGSVTGWATDSLGDRTVLSIGAAGCGLLAVGIGLVTHWGPFLLGSLLLVGAFASAPTAAGSHAVLFAFPPGQRGLAMGIRQTGNPLGGVLVAALLPPIAVVLGWRAAAVTSGLVSLLAAVGCLWLYQRNASMGEASAPGPEPRAAIPEGRGRGGPNRNLLFMWAATTILPMGQFSMATFLLLYLRDWQGIPIGIGALLVMAVNLSGATGRIVFSTASDRLFGGRRKPVLLIVVAIAVVMSLGLSSLPSGAPLWLVATVVILLGLALLGWHAVYITLITELADPGWEGRAVGVMSSAAAVGAMVGPVLFGFIVDKTGDYQEAWLLMSAALALGALILTRVRESAKSGA